MACGISVSEGVPPYAKASIQSAAPIGKRRLAKGPSGFCRAFRIRNAATTERSPHGPTKDGGFCIPVRFAAKRPRLNRRSVFRDVPASQQAGIIGTSSYSLSANPLEIQAVASRNGSSDGLALTRCREWRPRSLRKLWHPDIAPMKHFHTCYPEKYFAAFETPSKIRRRTAYSAFYRKRIDFRMRPRQQIFVCDVPAETDSCPLLNQVSSRRRRCRATKCAHGVACRSVKPARTRIARHNLNALLLYVG